MYTRNVRNVPRKGTDVIPQPYGTLRPYHKALGLCDTHHGQHYRARLPLHIFPWVTVSCEGLAAAGTGT